MKKSILCILLAGLSLISLTACSNNIEVSSEPDAQVVPTDAANITDSRKHIANLEGKTYGEIISHGYSYIGYIGSDNNYEFILAPEEVPEGVSSYLPALTQMTIGDLLDKDLMVGCMTDYETECVFDINAGSFCVNFEVEGGLDILKNYKDNEIIDVENTPELHNKKIINPVINSMEFNLKFKNDISALITDNFNDSVLNDYVVSEFYYIPMETAFM